jgi:parallel beta-helix repeat protein
MSKYQGLLLCTLLAAIAFTVVGCSSDKSSNPVISLSLDPDSTGVEICSTIDITADVAHGEASEIDWYVNGVLGGGAAQGTISQTNPATYSAPEAVPVQATVTVKAVSREDTAKADSCKVTVKFTVIHVNAATGSDESTTGCVTHPFKTITHALNVAQHDMTVLAAAGIYDGTNGETFPLYLGDRITLAGESREGTIIREDTDAMWGVGMYGEGARIRRLTLDNGGAPNTAWEIALHVGSDAVGAVIDSLTMPDPAYLSLIRVDGAANTAIKNCRLVAEAQSDRRGLEIVFGDVGTIIRDCVISGLGEGIFLNGSSNALVEGCTIENNAYGINMCCYNSDSNNPNPDLGGGARGSLGGNVIRNNSTYGLHNLTKSTIYAKYNTWGNDPPTVGAAAGSDIYNEGPGSVISE